MLPFRRRQYSGLSFTPGQNSIFKKKSTIGLVSLLKQVAISFILVKSHDDLPYIVETTLCEPLFYLIFHNDWQVIKTDCQQHSTVGTHGERYLLNIKCCLCFIVIYLQTLYQLSQMGPC